MTDYVEGNSLLNEKRINAVQHIYQAGTRTNLQTIKCRINSGLLNILDFLTVCQVIRHAIKWKLL